MKKIMIALVSSLLVSVVSHAASADKVNFSKIRLDGVQLIDKDNQNSFLWNVKRVESPSQDLLKYLAKETSAEAISPVWELAEESSFKNIYVFIGKFIDGEINFIYLMVNKNSTFSVSMRVKNVERDHMDLVHGSSYEPVYYKLISSQGPLFP